METEYQTFLDIPGLRKRMEEKRQQLAREKEELEIQKQSIAESFKNVSDQLNLLKVVHKFRSNFLIYRPVMIMKTMVKYFRIRIKSTVKLLHYPDSVGSLP